MCRVNVTLIRRLRTVRGWTVDRLADEANLDRRTIGRIENSKELKYEPHLATAVAIAKALEVELSEIVLDGLSSMAAQEDDVDRIVAAFNAADKAIRRTLSEGGDWGPNEASSVLSLLLARYRSAFTHHPEKDLKGGPDFVRNAYGRTKRASP